MNKSQIREKINSVTSNSSYLRVSDNHPLELYLGRNEKGFPTLRYNGNFIPAKISGNNLLNVKQIKFAGDKNSLLFCFNSDKDVSLFYEFCSDIISQTEDYKGNNGYAEIVNRYNKWRKMFTRNTQLLSEKEIIGLIGELMFLKEYAIPKYGNTVALNGWSGPEPTHKDFSYGDDWYEIKTISTAKNVAYISSIEQLDSDNDGHLIIYKVEKMSPSFSGINLNDLVKSIMNVFELDTDIDIFNKKLENVGYSYDEAYSSYVYNYVSMDAYSVNSNFPRLKAKELPIGVGNVSYELIISLIDKYRGSI